MDPNAITLIGSIAVALITSTFTLLGVVWTSKKQHDITLEEIKRQNDANNLMLKGEIALIKKDINNLEEKQDKHNSLIERMYKVENAIESIKSDMKS